VSGDADREHPGYSFRLSRGTARLVVYATFVGLVLTLGGLVPPRVGKRDPMAIVMALVIFVAYWVWPVWLARRFGASPRFEWRGGVFFGYAVLAWDELIARDRYLAVMLTPLVTIPVAAALWPFRPLAALAGLVLGGTLAVVPLWFAAALLLRAPRDALVRHTGDGFEVY
jgi:hypothetical protein